MSLPRVFHFSFYLSLALSALCLFYGEWEFLPVTALFYPVFLGFLFLAHRHEGKWELSLDGANRLGLIIGLGTLAWIYYKVPRSDDDLIAGGVPWPAALLPLLSPLLPILLLVKIFRPKTQADFWAFQTISLVIVTLACILAGDVWFFLLLGLFLASQFWCLGLYFLCRQRVRVEHGAATSRMPLFPASDAKSAEPAEPVPWALLGTWRALRWTLTVVLLGLVPFFLTPRHAAFQWVPHKLSGERVTIKTGVETGMDLHREGHLELSTDPAFDVDVMDAKGPYLALPFDQRWRVEVLDHYDRGKWKPWLKSPLFPREGPVPYKGEPLPSRKHFQPLAPRTDPILPPQLLVENQIYLHFRIANEKAGGLVMAEPVDEDHIGYSPVLGELGTATRLPLFRLIKEADTVMGTPPTQHVRYGQIITPVSQRGEYPADVGERYLKYLHDQAVSVRIAAWTREKLVELSQSADEIDTILDENLRARPEYHAQIAKALSHYLSASNHYTYSLNRRFEDHNIDPVEDFLLNVKEGHCERFAAALTLSLRSVGIPARIVKGYSGCESMENGRYLIRQNQAHSWVECLVPGDAKDSWKWLSLDPTPASTATDESLLPFVSWLWDKLQNPSSLWKAMVMDYNANTQTEAVSGLWQGMSLNRRQKQALTGLWERWRYPLLLAVVAGIGGFVAWRIRKRKVRLAAATVVTTPLPDFHQRLLQVLKRHCGIQPQLGQTPFEFAQTASHVLTARSLDANLATFPLLATNILYRLRFGGQEPTPDEARMLQDQLDHLDTALQQTPALAA